MSTFEEEQQSNQKAFEEQKALEDKMFRARELKNQIAYWKRQYADDPVTNAGAVNTIDSLQRELNGIPNAQYWS